jgi:hypothetical protein
MANTRLRGSGSAWRCCNSCGMSSRDLGSSLMSAMATWPSSIWGSDTVRISYFAGRRLFGGCPAWVRISLFFVAKAVLAVQSEPSKAFWTRIFKSMKTL